MKKTYVAPVAEKINFEYKDQVVVASGIGCYPQYGNIDSNSDKICDQGDKYQTGQTHAL